MMKMTRIPELYLAEPQNGLGILPVCDRVPDPQSYFSADALYPELAEESSMRNNKCPGKIQDTNIILSFLPGPFESANPEWLG